MIYKEFQNLKLSNLGLGMMRLPLNEEGLIDEVKTEEMIKYALENGINYFDTAWGYHNGESENVVGKILSKYARETYYLASKFPGYDLSNMGKVEEIFNKQLEKCNTPYFDFYLIHNVCEKNIDEYLNEKNGILPYLLKQKEEGKIKKFGFSIHGDLNTLNRFLEMYGPYMEFAQIQLNYLDYEFQAANAKMEVLKKLNIPIWVMEPLRGGKLVNKLDEYKDELDKYRENVSSVEWAFRFLQTFPEVKVILSGMSNLEQLKQNIEIFNEDKPLNENEFEALKNIGHDVISGNVLPCTACRYCTEKCPMGLDIPMLIDLYNEHSVTGGGFIPAMRLEVLSEDKKPSACIGCKACEAVCPQNIKISEAMDDFSKKMGLK